jgi:hypothetical protein
VADQLSISSMLKLLQVIPKSDEQNNILKLCREAEILRRRRNPQKALDVIESAVQLAHNAFDHTLEGTTLLYASQIRVSAHLPDEEQHAIYDCDRAIRLLSLEPHNRIVARIIRAQIELQISHADCQQVALNQFIKASQELRRLATDAREHNDPEQSDHYTNLYDAVEMEVRHLSDSLVRAFPVRGDLPTQGTTWPQSTKSSLSSQFFQEMEFPIKVIPMQQIWPMSQLVGSEFVPMIGGAALDYIEVSRISIQGKLYALKPTTPSFAGALRLHAGQTYFTLPLAGNTDQKVLIRQRDRPDRAQQMIVVADQSNQQVWLDESESSAPYTHVHIIGLEREWDIKDEPQTTSYNQGMLHFIGIVEAVLTPIE